MSKVAILVDGGFYRKRATSLFGKKDAEARAKELQAYCLEHAKGCELYRIFYYDCPPIEATVYHPFTRKNVNLKKSETYQWTIDFLNALKKLRKFALRLGRLADSQAAYILNSTSTKKLFDGQVKLDEIAESDFVISVKQKGVDMKIGVDIASLAYKQQVSKIILISGDSDFVPAAKLARREGVDFVLDPMWASIKEDLHEHIDGLMSQWKDQRKKCN